MLGNKSNQHAAVAASITPTDAVVVINAFSCNEFA
jgi:NhaP-type Na+/H+ or K+/H+ antiporter